jgi:hypothetical protein
VGSVPRWLLRHTIAIEPYQGADSFGASFYGPAVTVRCFLDAKVRMVRDAGTGAQVVSSSTAYAPLETVAPAESRVTLPDGRVTAVMQALRRDGAGLPTPDHLEIVLE